MKTFVTTLLLTMVSLASYCQPSNYELNPGHVYLDSKDGHNGGFMWVMKKSSEVTGREEDISKPSYNTAGWMPAVVPGTVLNSLVYNKVYPEPYYGMNNKKIPDIIETGRAFYTYWFRTEFNVPESYKGKQVMLQVDGINYRAEVWVNGRLVDCMNGMFKPSYINITDFANIGSANALAIKVYPVDVPGTIMPKKWGAVGEFHNGGDGNIGLNTTMLMSVGWDFTFLDGIRDRNTGIWRSVSLYATESVSIRHPFVKSELSKPRYDMAKESVSVEVTNQTNSTVKCTVAGTIEGGISFKKDVQLLRGEEKEIVFTPAEFSSLVIKNPRLWWPVNKGKQEMYELKMTVSVDGVVSDSVKTRFGIREITSDQNTPDKSRAFYVNGKKIFIRGTNWIPEGMLRMSDKRTYAELRYTRQSGVNLVRLWGGGIAESDYFYQMCDEMGLLVWQEFWLTGDTKHPQDRSLYLANMEATVKRLRNHPSLAYYVSSNESTEVTGAKELLMSVDGTRGYQMQSECDGVHDGSPYKQVNPMQHYENTASDRGSRIDGFNPEYGAPTMPTLEALREMMDEKDIWPVNKEVWDYHDGGGFSLMSSLCQDFINEYGKPVSAEDMNIKGQLVGAINSKSIWETWNYNKLNYGDRYASGLLFWYNNSPVRQVSTHIYDWSLEPTAALYHTQNALEPLHAQYDYLKNTVSVCNDYYRSFSNYKVRAEVYNLYSKKLITLDKKFSIGDDEVLNDLLKIEFPADITPVHFIKLYVFDDKGKEVASTFYWRSTNEYKGRKTVTGPASAGFQGLSAMPHVSLKTSYTVEKKDGWQKVRVTIVNKNKTIAFFTQLQLLDKDSKPVRPSFFTDNFFSLMPGEKKTIEIETALSDIEGIPTLKVKGWNINAAEYKVR